jgi:thiosulfate reductase cytochrome b subunit
MGLAMSPHMDSVLGWMVDLVGGRQSARTWHFIIAIAFVAFIAIHVFMVLVSGPVNQIRSMITGRYQIHDEPATPPAGDDHVEK